ncbi:proton-coupled folate transporter-like [Galleria mellonella]|uniref:Proton-coupled folate transporter-like n=1 Tax=Galleria mellonella TaxID=7137 RepID=A0ABM3MJC8_GALME|nr:proton-coupled folate transporter-like [Galleria mellonella]
MADKKTRIPEEVQLKDEEKVKESLENKTFVEKLCYIKSNITVEPIFAGLVIPSMLARLAVQNLNLDKACRVKLQYGDAICDALIEKKGNHTIEEVEVQKVISAVESWKSVVQTALPCLLVIFMGAWSDRTGNRKLCILMPIFGELFANISNLISTILFSQISVEVTMFLEAIFPAITGGWVMIFLGIFSYITDITTEESRTFRVGVANLCLTAGIPIGSSLSGILLKWLGYYGIFTISCSIYITTILYGIFYLKSNTKPRTNSNEESKPLTLTDLITLVKDTAMVAFKKRHGNTRIKIILTLFVVAIIYGPDQGEKIVTYMFLRYRLKWDALRYSIYSTYSIIIHSLSALFSISLFSKRLGFHDSMLCLISITSRSIGSTYMAFVYTDFQMFMVPIVGILNATTFTSLRSMISKLVPSEEAGKMNSLFSLVETLAALMFNPIYSILYLKTISIFSGSVFIFSGILTLPAIIVLIWLFNRHRRETKQKQLEDVEMRKTEEIVDKEST